MWKQRFVLEIDRVTCCHGLLDTSRSANTISCRDALPRYGIKKKRENDIRKSNFRLFRPNNRLI